jgi:hypothetical protein
MNPFLSPPDPSSRRVIDSSATDLDPSRPSTRSDDLVPVAVVTPWPPPPPVTESSPPQVDDGGRTSAGGRSTRWPHSPLQRAAAAVFALLVLGGLAVLLGLPSADSGDVLDGLGSYVTVVGLGVAGAMVSVVTSTRRTPSQPTADRTDALVFRVAFGALAALILVVLLQSDTQNVVNADGQTAHLWAIIGGFAERFSRPFVAQSTDR